MDCWFGDIKKAASPHNIHRLGDSLCLDDILQVRFLLSVVMITRRTAQWKYFCQCEYGTGNYLLFSSALILREVSSLLKSCGIQRFTPETAAAI